MVTSSSGSQERRGFTSKVKTRHGSNGNLHPKEKLHMRYNVLDKYHPVLIKCIEQKLWMSHGKNYFGPYDWAFWYGKTGFGEKIEIKTADPYQLLKDGLDVLKKKPNNPKLRKRYEDMLRRVLDYYQEDKDKKLLLVMKTGKW